MPDEAVVRILYVGVDTEYFDQLSEVLERALPSFAFTLATDREEALAFLDSESVDGLVLEPGVDGGWRPLLEAFRDRWPDLPAMLAVDESGTEDVASEMVDAGVDNVLDRTEAPTRTLAVPFEAVVERYRALADERAEADWYEAVLEGMGDFVVIFGIDSAVKYVSPSIEHVTGYTPADVEAMGPFGYVHHDDQPDIIDAFYELMTEPPGSTAKVETRAQHADGTWRIHEGVGTNLLGVDPIDGLVVSVRDITDPARPKALLDEHLDRVTEAFFALDPELRFAYVNERSEALLGMTEAELLGAPFDVAFADPTGAAAFETNFERAIATGQTVTFEARYPPGDIWTEVRAYPSETGLSVYLSDITDRKRREQDLERYETIVETVSDGVFTVDMDGYLTYVNHALVELTGYSRDELLGSHVSLLVDEDAIARGQQLDELLRTTDRTEGVIEAEVERADGERVPTETRFAILPQSDGGPVSVGIVRDVSERVRREEHLQALNRLNSVIREIVRTLASTASRDRLESLVCERLTESDTYALAWIGDVDQHTGTVTPRASAGRGQGIEDLVTALAAADGDSNVPGPASEAAASRAVQVVSDLDGLEATWATLAADHGFRTAIAIPFVYDGVRYGVLTLYSRQADAIDEEHRDILGQLREVVGHGINAIEREAALLSDRIVEFKLRSRQAAEPFGELADIPWPVTIESVVRSEGDDAILYLSARGGRDRVEAALETAPAVQGWRIIRQSHEETLFEVPSTQATMLPDITSYGAYVRTATLADGALTVVAEVSPTHDIRAVYEAIKSSHPDLELVSRQFGDHEDRMHVDRKGTIEERLTVQQRRALETAYYSGFFEWPRDSTGEEVAAALQIAPSTFHKHLRLGEQKIMATVFD